MSANKLIFFERFNEKTYEFIKDLATAFPQVREFSEFKSGFSLLRNTTPQTPQKIFNNYVLSKYRDFLVRQDESFFLEEKEFGLKDDSKEYWFDFIQKLKSIWKDLDAENKQVIWKYFHVLILLSDKCAGC